VCSGDKVRKTLGSDQGGRGEFNLEGSKQQGVRRRDERESVTQDKGNPSGKKEEKDITIAGEYRKASAIDPIDHRTMGIID
jgi:hypothetical protein